MVPTIEWMTSRLKLKHLRLLIQLEEQGSLLKAATFVSMTQPAATKALQDIEAALGSALFVRTNRGLTPNDLGRCVTRYARLIVQDLNHLRTEMAGIMSGHGGQIAVGTIMGAVPLLTHHLSVVLQSLPDLRVELVEEISGQLLSLLDSGKLDLAICRTSVSARPDLYKSERICEEQLAVVANVSHPLAGKKSSLAELSNCRWIVYAANMPMRRYLEHEFLSNGLTFPTQLIETTSAFATLSLLQRNPTFVALLSTEVANVLNKTHTTTTLDIGLPARSEPYYLVSRADRALSPAAELLMKSVRDGSIDDNNRDTRHVDETR